MKELNLYHFFPDKLNLYGDRGNIIILKKRCEWRGIQLNVHEVKKEEDLHLSNADLLFIGGGSNREQSLCTDELFKIKDEFKSAVDDGVAALTICGGYQFLGDYYETAEGEKLRGLGILNFYSKATSNDPKDRLIGDLRVQSERFGRIVGYENHSGETFHTYDTIGEVIGGYGNNRTDRKEGLVYNHLIGTYLHGPILSKNPRIADWLIQQALERKYGDSSILKEYPIDDEFAHTANEQIWNRVETNHKKKYRLL